MGVFLDTSVPIKAQRMRLTEAEMLIHVRGILGEVDLGISAIVVTELLVGAYRGTPNSDQRRLEFISQLVRDVPVYPYLPTTANLAGTIGGRQAGLGRTIPPIDLMIGATALSLGFSVLTTNVRHFRMIPGLDVIPF